MRADTIAKLAWYRPRSNFVAGLYSCHEVGGLSPEQAADIAHYAECHKDLQFGWNIAKDLLRENIPFPAFLYQDDLHVWKAYNFLKGNYDATIAGAVALTSKGNEQTANTIKALLIADDMTCEYVANKLSIPVDIIKAYEKLFFNVLDRKKDRAYIAEIVYPRGRMAEAMENYLEEAGIGELMMRAGLTQGAKHVLFAAGIEGNPFAKLDVVAGAEEMDKRFMAEGLVYAGLGWLNQRKNAMSIANARLSLQAGKMGRGEQAGGVTDLGLGDALREELIAVGHAKSAAQLSREADALVAEVPANVMSQ